MPYDIFISYSREDNKAERVTSLVKQISVEFQNFAGRELNTFFDKQSIEGMDDWEHKILGGLRDSKIMITVLSPNYLKSEYCKWEYHEFRRHEISRGMLNEGLAPIYFVEIPEFFEKGYEKKLEDWVRDLLKLNYFDLRNWYKEGENALKEIEIKTQLSQLSEKLSRKIKEGEIRSQMLGNVDRHNPSFIGRSSELRLLREELSKKVVGILTAVHGIGGMGKTALAIEYAHVFAHDYGGGCWQLGCEGKDNLQQVIAELYLPLGIDFDDEEKKDVGKRFQKVLTALKSLCKQSYQSRCLIILDNVDKPELLSPYQIKALPSADWLQIIATSRLGASDLHGTQMDRKFIPVDELPEEDALALIQNHQPSQTFSSDVDRSAALEIVKLLGGFTLAVEAVAVFMGELADEVSFADFLTRLKKDGLEGLDQASSLAGGGLMHGERSLAITLHPTLEKLNPEELLTLSFASLLPADQIALPWLRVMVAKEFPEFEMDAEVGMRDAWSQVLGKLLSLRLFRVAGYSEKGIQIKIVRMHRVLGEILRNQFRINSQLRQGQLLEHSVKRSEYLKENWHNPEDRWEVESLVRFTEQLLDNANLKVAQLALNVASTERKLGSVEVSKRLCIKAIEIWEKKLLSEHPNLATFYNELALVENDLGNLMESKLLHQKSINIYLKKLPPDHPVLVTSYNNLALVEGDLGNLTESKLLHQKSINFKLMKLPSDHPDLGSNYNNLAIIEQKLGNLNESKQLFKKSINIQLKVLPTDHPDLVNSYSNLAVVEQYLGNLGESKRLLQQVIEIYEKKLPLDHPDLACSYSNLATIEWNLGNLKEAKQLQQKATKIWENILPKDHPNLATSYSNTAIVEEDLGNLEESKQLHHKAIEIREKKLPTDHLDLAISYFNLALLEANLGNLKESKQLLQKAIEIQEKKLPADHLELVVSYNNLAVVEQNLGNLEESKRLYLKTIEIREKNLPSDKTDLAKCLYNLAVVEQNLGNSEESKRLLQRVIEIRETKLTNL